MQSATPDGRSLSRSSFLQESARIPERTAAATSPCAADCVAVSAARELLRVYACMNERAEGRTEGAE